MSWQPSGDEIRAARERIKRYVVATPLLRADFLDRQGLRVFLKPENLQRSGSFKVRGAFNALASLDPEARARGTIAFSSGNHGQAVALASHDLGWVDRGQPYPCTIVMPEDALPLKIQRTKALGAEVVFAGRSTEDRRLKAEEIAKEKGLTVIPAYDHPAVVSGQGSLGLEIMDQWMGIPSRTRRLGLVAAPLGGGGMLAGVAAALRARGFAGKLYGVEPAAGNETQQSLLAGERVRIEVPDTVCDGLRAVIPGEITFPILQKCQVEVVTATEDAVKSAAYWLLETLKLLVEPSGAVAVAAWIAGAIAYAPEAEEVVDVVLVLSGGNADPATVAGWRG